MKRFKKLLSMILAIVMVVGAVNLPTKEAKAADNQATLALAEAYGGCQDGETLRRYVLNFDVTGAAIGGSTWGNNTVYIDGVAKTGEGVNYLYDSTSNVLSLYLTYAQVEEGKTTAASIGKHSLVIKKGTVIGDTEITNDVAIVLNANTISTATPIKLAYNGGGAQDGSLARYAMNFTVTGATAVGNYYWDNNTVYIGDRAESGSGVNWLGDGATTLSLYLTYAHVQSDATVASDISETTMTVKDGTIFGYNASNYLVTTKAETVNINKTSLTRVIVPDVTLTLNDDPSRNQMGTASTGFYFFGSQADLLPDDVENWTKKYAMATGGIYHNGTVLPNARLVKLTDTLYYVDLVGATLASGDLVKVEGTVENDDYVVKYEAESFTYDGNGNWEKGVHVVTTPVTFTISRAAESEKLHLTTSDIPHDGESVARDTFFEAVDDSSVYKFNGTDLSVKPRFAFGGLYLAMSEVTSNAQSAAAEGDTITIGGVWKHLYDNAYYDFGDATTYKWNGSTWVKTINIETDTVVPTLTIAANRSDLLMLAIEGVSTPSADTKFEAYDENSVYLYNGVASQYDMIYSKHGGIYADPGYMRGDMTHATSYVDAVAGDTITIGGVWKYTGDGQYYNFKTTTYEWNGSGWGVQPTPLTLTESQVVDRPGSNDWMFYMTPSFEIDDSLFGTAGDMYLGVCDPIVTVGTTETTATNSEIYIFPNNDDVGVTIKRTFLSGTPTTGTTVTFPAGMRITYNNVVYRTTEAFVWRYNGSSWVKYVKPDTYTPTLTTGSNAETKGVYLTNDDDMPYDTNWQLNYTAEDSESGVWVNGSRTEVFLKKIDATKWYVCLVDKGISAERGTTVAVKGTFVNDENTITFEETTYIYDGAKWCTGSTLDTDFAITEMGDSTYQAGLGWKLRFVTDSVVYGEDFVTDLGTYTIQVDGVDTQVNCTSTGAPGYGLGILVEDLAQNPQGTIVTVPAGQIGEYTLTNTYEIIYDAGEWKLAHETHPVTLTFSHKMGGTNNLVFRHSEDLTALLTKGQTFKATYADSGIYVNGEKAKDAGIFWWTETNEDNVITSSYFVVDHGSIAKNRGDIVTVRGTFNLGEIYLNFSEASCRFVNDTSWVTSCNYESVQQVFVTDIASGAWQETYSRWLFTASTSTPLEHDSAEFITPFSPKELIVTITDKDGNAKTLYELPAYNANIADKTAANYLGFIIEETLGLPQDATGWSITIEPCYLQTTEKTYKIMSAFTYKYDSNTESWKVESEREKPASGVFADANGDSKFNAADLVSALKEYEGRLTADSKKYLCAPDALIAGKTTVQLSDTIRIREELLDRSYLTPTTEAYIPVYLDDEEIQLGAYKGPRAISEDRRYDDDGNQLTDGVDYTRTGFLTDEMFQWYADAGLNTLISEGDAPFNSEGDYGMKAVAGYWTNLVSYMNLADKYDLDVYVLSGATTAYLRNNTVQTATNSGTETNVEISTEDMQNDLKEMLTGAGSGSHPTYGLLSFDNFKGIMLADELIEEYLPNYLTVNQYLATIAPDIEVTSAALSAKAEGDEDLITTNYENYATKYAQYSMNKDFLYNFYPYQGDATESGFLGRKEYDYDPANAKTESSWLDQLEGSAVRAANGGWTTGIAIQSFAMNHHIRHDVWRSPSEKRDIGFQVYTSLAYGMKSFNYFTYWEHDRQSSEGEVHTDSMVYIDSNNQPQRSDIYYAVQAVNKEITQFDHVYLDYDWQSTINIGSSDLFGSLTKGSSSRIASSSATEEAIIGCMYDDQKDLDGFWIVNATIPEDNLSNTVTVKFNNATRAMVFNPATGTYGDVINLTDGTYTANLASGEGQFVIPLP